MGQQSKIEWTDATWNPVTGCTKVSAGCKNCYAERQFHRPYPGRDFTDVRTHLDRLLWPLKWRGSKQAKAEGRSSRIFVNSMSDLFHESVPAHFIDQCFAVMALAGNHVFQVLTKRPERMTNYFDLSHVAHLPLASICAEARIARIAESIATMRREKTTGANWDLFLEQPYSNVWLGVSVEDQKTADERIPLLLQTPAAVRFVSYEPALGPVNFWKWLGRPKYPDARPQMQDEYAAKWKLLYPRIDWIIAGGESGANARPSHPNWFRSIRNECQARGLPFFFKQWGEWVSVSEVAGDGPHFHFPDDSTVRRVGKKRAGRLLDGREWNEFPKQEPGVRSQK